MNRFNVSIISRNEIVLLMGSMENSRVQENVNFFSPVFII